MARSRAYRSDIRGPDCGSNWMRQNGFTNDRQTYRCGAPSPFMAEYSRWHC